MCCALILKKAFYVFLMPLGYLGYIFKVMPSLEICKKKLKVIKLVNVFSSLNFRLIFVCGDADDLLVWFYQISVDVEHAKCSICLNIWHDVVTVAPCLHNFWSVTYFNYDIFAYNFV